MDYSSEYDYSEDQRIRRRLPCWKECLLAFMGITWLLLAIFLVVSFVLFAHEHSEREKEDKPTKYDGWFAVSMATLVVFLGSGVIMKLVYDKFIK